MWTGGRTDGRQRPLGIAALEDKIVQRAVVEVLNAIYESDFLGFSYGFRPRRSQHDALDALAVAILRRKVNWVLDGDIRGFFDAIDHGWLVKFLEHRIGDRRVVRLVQKWLAAGVLENGTWTPSEVGSPQGAPISPLLANLYLHYVFDLWVHRWRQKAARGELARELRRELPLLVHFLENLLPALAGRALRGDALGFELRLHGTRRSERVRRALLERRVAVRDLDRAVGDVATVRRLLGRAASRAAPRASSPGLAIDPVTADATEDAVGAVASGLLQTDGAMVEVQPFSTHVSELAKVRGIRFKRVASGAIGFSADAGSAPSESGVVRLGYRAGDVNNLERPAWAWKPARELFQKLVARGRRRRQGDGLTVTPRYLVRSSQRTVAAVGAVEPRIIDCPMVRTPEALEREPGADTFEPMRPVCSTTIGG